MARPPTDGSHILAGPRGLDEFLETRIVTSRTHSGHSVMRRGAVTTTPLCAIECFLLETSAAWRVPSSPLSSPAFPAGAACAASWRQLPHRSCLKGKAPLRYRVV